MKKVLHTMLVFGLVSCSATQPVVDAPDAIRLNQVGFYPDAPKHAIVISEEATTFHVITVKNNRKIFSSSLSEPRKYDYSPVKVRVADFSAVTETGEYVLVVPGVGQSYRFVIQPRVHEAVAKASLKNFYYQRMSMPLQKEYAGQWSRPASHPDDEVKVHASAATRTRPEGYTLSCPRGWYDAGDYNKYVVNSGITMGTLLSAYEDFPDYFRALELNIPESGNSIPDILDEALWNLRWMLTMQDPEDGGVYHKLTNARFDPMIMPHEAKTTRYVVQKSTSAALNLAAVMAQAARVYASYENQLPGLADSCLSAARKAWVWAKQNPHIHYDQDAMNKQFDPDIVTGAYGDRDFSDEFAWAAAELWITTQDHGYFSFLDLEKPALLLPSWNQVRLLGYYSLLRYPEILEEHLPLKKVVHERVVMFANSLLDGFEREPYRTVMGKTPKDFVWGSSAVAANQGIALLQAHKVTKEKKFKDAALANLDYLLGRNGTGYSFVTGYGSKRVLHPHHRPSEADGIDEPVPGMLSGGPNPGKQDKCTTYTSSVPNEAFTDDVCSYASNEVAINWNAPLVYLAGAVEALHMTTPK